MKKYRYQIIMVDIPSTETKAAALEDEGFEVMSITLVPLPAGMLGHQINSQAMIVAAQILVRIERHMPKTESEKLFSAAQPSRILKV